jgi:ribonuclease Z
VRRNRRPTAFPAPTSKVLGERRDFRLTRPQFERLLNAVAADTVFYHLLPAPDGILARRVFARGIDEARHGNWTIANDGSLYTLPIGSDTVRIGRIVE